MPRPPIIKLFGSSPARPLQHHMTSVQECIAQLQPHIDAVLAYRKIHQDFCTGTEGNVFILSLQ